MTTTRSGYAIALVVAVLILIGSVGMAMAYAAGGGWAGARSYGSAADDWRQGLGGQMMGQGSANWCGQMMGQMMGQGHGDGYAQMGLAEGKALADAWLSSNQPGAAADSGIQTPMGLMFTVSQDGAVEGTLMVIADTGQIYYHQWSAAEPVPSPS